jgi:predicted transcriptional regulator
MKIIVKTNDGEIYTLENHHHLQELKEKIKKTEDEETDQAREQYENPIRD